MLSILKNYIKEKLPEAVISKLMIKLIITLAEKLSKRTDNDIDDTMVAMVKETFNNSIKKN